MSNTLRTIQQTTRLFNNVTLTSAFSGNVGVAQSLAGVDQATFYAIFTPGTNGDNLDIQLEFSHDNSNWYIEQAVSTSAGTTTAVDNLYTRDGATAATVYKLRFTVPVADLWVRASVRYVGTGAGTCTLHMTTAGI